MSSAKLIFCLSVSYLISIKILTFLMKSLHNGLKLKFVMFCYHLVLLFLNAYISARIVYIKYKANDFKLCSSIKSQNTTYSVEINKIVWWFFILKGLECIDTIFFILRKKFHKVSFLHLYNHATMFVLWYFTTGYYANGTSAVAAFMNSLIHVLMYYYYTVSALGPSFQRLVFWKKYLILFQIVI